MGIAAGTINTVVGSGTLITFPTLLAFNYSPVLANVSNNIGLVPGTLSGALGYRDELSGQRARVIALGTASLCGGLTGAILLLILPADAFKAIIPVLIAIALVMVVAQPWLATWVTRRQQARRARRVARGAPTGAPAPGAAPGAAPGPAPGPLPGAGADAVVGPVLWFLVFCTGVYGGYFGAAQGVLLIGLLGAAYNDSLQRLNAVKNVLATLVNGIAAVVFVLVSHIAWAAAALIAAGSVLGGLIGARVGRRLPPWALRLVIVCVGGAALVKLLV